MQTFSNLRRSFFNNPFTIIISLIGVIVVTGFLSSKFIVLVFCGFSYLAFMHYMKNEQLFMSTLILILEAYISSILGLWSLALPLYFVFYFIFITKTLSQFTLPPQFSSFIHIGLFYFVFLIVWQFVDELSFHIFWVVFYNLLFDLFLALVLL